MMLSEVRRQSLERDVQTGDGLAFKSTKTEEQFKLPVPVTSIHARYIELLTPEEVTRRGFVRIEIGDIGSRSERVE